MNESQLELYLSDWAWLDQSCLIYNTVNITQVALTDTIFYYIKPFTPRVKPCGCTGIESVDETLMCDHSNESY